MNTECRECGEPLVEHAPFGEELVAFYPSARAIFFCLMCGFTEVQLKEVRESRDVTRQTSPESFEHHERNGTASPQEQVSQSPNAV